MPVVEEVCTITAKGQTTVPKAVRQALGVGYGGRIAFRVTSGAASPCTRCRRRRLQTRPWRRSLVLLETDMASRPAEAVRPFPKALAGHLEALAAEVGEVDPDASIEGKVSL